MPAEDAVFAGWDALREAMSSWGIQSREDLSEWIHNQGLFNQGGGHISVHEPRREFSMVLWPVTCVAQPWNQHAYRSRCRHAKGCSQNRPIKCSQLMTVSAHRQHPSSPVLPHLGRCWTSHPHSSRGTPSSSIGGGCNRRFALGSCSVLPFWLLRRPHGGDVGKVELSKRFDDFAAGSWTQLHRNVRSS